MKQRILEIEFLVPAPSDLEPTSSGPSFFDALHDVSIDRGGMLVLAHCILENHPLLAVQRRRHAVVTDDQAVPLYSVEFSSCSGESRRSELLC